jgi:cobalt/nickel transport system permease protein
MHMADALLSVPVGLAFFGASGALLAYSAKKAAADDGYERKLPLMGVLGAFVFAAQMINFSIPGTGSSGHLGGGILLAALLGPYAALVVVSSVLFIQCLFFADGGLLALGCNIFNLGFWPSFAGLLIFSCLGQRTKSTGSLYLSAVAAVVVSSELGAFSAVIETLLSGRSELPFREFAVMMLGINLPIAVVEGMVTAGVLQHVCRFIPREIHKCGFAEKPAARPVLAALLGVAFFLSTAAVWFASAQPDSLEWSIGKVYGKEELPASQGGLKGMLDHIRAKTAILPDYKFTVGERRESREEGAGKYWPAIDFSKSVAGFVGSVMTALLVLLFGRIFHLARTRGQAEVE